MVSGRKFLVPVFNSYFKVKGLCCATCHMGVWILALPANIEGSNNLMC